MRSTTLGIGATIAMLLLHTGSATMSISNTIEAPSGDYLDPRTSILYYYNAATGALVPSATGVGTSGYFEIDLYAPGASPAASTGHTGSCQASGYCVAVLVAAANPDQDLRRLKIEVTDTCADPWQDQRSFSGAVFPYNPKWPVGDCGIGTATGRIFLDGVEMDNDTLDH